MPQWTPQQEQAIYCRGENLLVSAAAGSGKTAVLSARVAEYIRQGGSFDRLLIVTFTRLAAGEMRQRIAEEVASLAAKIGTAHLKRQSLLLYKAQICTIDSFAIDLLRQHFSTAGIAADFRVMDETEAAVLKTRAVREVLEEAYTAFPPGFGPLLSLLGGEGEDQKLRDCIELLLTRTETLPFPEKKLNQWAETARNPKQWCEAACQELLPEMEEYRSLWKRILSGCFLGGQPGPQAELNLLEALCKALAAENWTEACRLVASFSFTTAPRISISKKDTPHSAPLPTDDAALLAEQYKTLRPLLKKTLSGEIFLCTPAETAADLARLAPAIECLFNLTLACGTRLQEAYRKKGAYPFSAIAQLALTAVVTDYQPKDGSFSPTPLALTLREKYDEVLIDEYQDVNDLQDLFFRAITQDNLFAVGDAKQSIYRFRGANPDNFLQAADRCRVIPLNRNFRSRPDILHFANFLCQGLFSLRTGGLEYEETQALSPGRTDLDNTTPGAQVILTEDQPRTAAALIRDRVIGKMQICDKSGVQRPVRWGDFAILLKKRKDVAPLYEQALSEAGIPCYADTGGCFLDAPETGNVLAFLRAVENPYDDLSLFAALSGPVLDLTDEQIAKIRLTGGETLYDSLCLATEILPEARQAKKRLDRWRLLSRSLSVRRLLWQLYAEQGILNTAAGDADPEAKERLMKLYAFAGGSSGEGGLYTFLKAAAEASLSGEKSDEASAPGGDGVRILSIHRSKGLEFPICILPEWDRPTNRAYTAASILLDPELGPATRLRTPDGSAETTTLMREVLLHRERRKTVSEDLRLIYVALTRAREEVLLLADPSRKKRSPELLLGICTPEGQVLPNVLCDTPELLTPLLARLLRHPAAVALCLGRPWWEPEAPGALKLEFRQDEELKPAQPTPRTEIFCGLSPEELKRRFSFVHGSPLSQIPAKVSVTEISKRAPDPDSVVLFDFNRTMTPRFLSEQKGLSPAERGTAMHRFCQYANLNKTPEEELVRLRAEGRLTGPQAEAVDLAGANAFFQSRLAQQIRSARQVWREESFVTRIPTSFYTGQEQEGTLLLQGAIDLLCDTPEGLLLVDFKTDRVSKPILLERYTRQIELYRYAVLRLFGFPVTQAALWSFFLGAEIDI